MYINVSSLSEYSKVFKVFLLLSLLFFCSFFLYDSNKTSSVQNRVVEASAGEMKYHIARFGTGNIVSAVIDDAEFRSLRLGWHHNWSVSPYFSPYHQMDPDIIADTLFYGLVGGYSSDQCQNYYNEDGSIKSNMVAHLEQFPDRSIIWIGNELGYDDNRDPTTYATEYKYCYDMVKEINPNILVAIGANPGMPSFHTASWRVNNWVIPEDPEGRWSGSGDITTNHFSYLTYVFDDYRKIYEEELPYDAFVLHFYPSLAPGCVDFDCVVDDLTLFRETFMDDPLISTKPIIVKEFGAVVGFDPEWPQAQQDAFFENEVEELKNFHNLFLDMKGPLGNPHDGGRYVQLMAWFNGDTQCESVADKDCMWNSAMYYCEKVEGSHYLTNCASEQARSPIGDGFIDYVTDLSLTYDRQPPSRPRVSFSLDNDQLTLNLSAADNDTINTFILSAGSQIGLADHFSWRTIGPNETFELMKGDVLGYFVNIIARDDGYNESSIGTVLIPGTCDPSCRIDQLCVLNTCKNISADTDLNEEVNMNDYATFVGDYLAVREDDLNYDARSDMNLDGIIDMNDYTIWVSSYLRDIHGIL